MYLDDATVVQPRASRSRTPEQGAAPYRSDFVCQEPGPAYAGPGMTDQQVAKVAKIMVLVLTSGAVVLALYSSMSLVSLWLLGSVGVAQFFPGGVLGLFSRRVTTSGVFAGLVTGIVVALLFMLTGRDPYHGVNAGLIALGFNFGMTGVVSLLTPMRIASFEEILPAAAASRSGSSVSLT